jgi:hypothetical protein
MELMAAIVCGRIERLVGADGDIADVATLLGEMDCVRLWPEFSLVLRRWGTGREHSSANGDDARGGPLVTSPRR